MQDQRFSPKDCLDKIVVSYKKKSGHYNMKYNHFHDSYEIYYLVSGERYYFVNDRTFHITKGSIAFINPFELHKTTDITDTCNVPDHERILIQFDKKYFKDNNAMNKVLASVLNNSQVIKLSVSEQLFVEELLNSLLEEDADEKLGYEANIQAQVIRLIVYIARIIQGNLSKDFEHLSEMHKKVSEIVQYVNTSYSEPITLSVVADKFFISQYHLARIFKKATGFTFIEYLNSIRVKHAQKLLQETKWKVSRISNECGFGSISQFGRCFKKIYGVSPRQYKDR